METKIYHCQDPAENPVPAWLRANQAAASCAASDPVEAFKKDPDSFFATPDFKATSCRCQRI